MDSWFEWFAPIIPFALVLGVVFIVMKKQKKNIETHLNWVNQWGFNSGEPIYKKGSLPTIPLKYRHRTFELASMREGSATEGDSIVFTEFRIPVKPEREASFAITKESCFHSWFKKLGLNEAQTGDPEFDKTFFLGTQKEQNEYLMSLIQRSRIVSNLMAQKETPRFGSIELKNKGEQLTYRTYGLILKQEQADHMRHMLDILCDLADAIEGKSKF